MRADPTADVERLLGELELARAHTSELYADVAEADVFWRPSPNSSAIGWHLGHQAAVGHFLLRNLISAEPSISAAYDRVFDSATPEPDRGELPPLEEIERFRATVAERIDAQVAGVLGGAVGAPQQLRRIAETLLIAAINHEYQHDCWIAEVRESLGYRAAPDPDSTNLERIDGYWVVAST